MIPPTEKNKKYSVTSEIRAKERNGIKEYIYAKEYFL